MQLCNWMLFSVRVSLSMSARTLGGYFVWVGVLFVCVSVSVCMCGDVYNFAD